MLMLVLWGVTHRYYVVVRADEHVLVEAIVCPELVDLRRISATAVRDDAVVHAEVDRCELQTLGERGDSERARR